MQEFESGDDESESDSDVEGFGECEQRIKSEDGEDEIEEDEMCCD
jgi:hypothetical protein